MGGVQLLTANLKTGPARFFTENGRQYAEAEAVIIVPGVLPGSKGPLYYPPAEVAKRPGAWNNVLVTAYHPFDPATGSPLSSQDRGVRERQGIGLLRNDRFQGGRRRVTVRFDLARTENYDKQLRPEARMVPRLRRGEPIELSTGLYTDDIPANNGKCPMTGRPYTHTAVNYRPDHLAVLPDQKGACSLDDGCGVLVNTNPQEINQNCGGVGGKPGPCSTGGESIPEHAAVGKLVKFQMPYAGGSFSAASDKLPKTKTVAGTVKSHKPGGILEVKLQQGGYAVIHHSEIQTQSTKNSNDPTINPFVSRSQQRACYAKDDPDWDCHEWSDGVRKADGVDLPETKTENEQARDSDGRFAAGGASTKAAAASSHADSVSRDAHSFGKSERATKLSKRALAGYGAAHAAKGGDTDHYAAAAKAHKEAATAHQGQSERTTGEGSKAHAAAAAAHREAAGKHAAVRNDDSGGEPVLLMNTEQLRDELGRFASGEGSGDTHEATALAAKASLVAHEASEKAEPGDVHPASTAASGHAVSAMKATDHRDAMESHAAAIEQHKHAAKVMGGAEQVARDMLGSPNSDFRAARLAHTKAAEMHKKAIQELHRTYNAAPGDEFMTTNDLNLLQRFMGWLTGNTTDNAQSRHIGTGQFLHTGGKIGGKQVHTAAARGKGDTDAVRQPPADDPDDDGDTEDLVMGQGDRGVGDEDHDAGSAVAAAEPTHNEFDTDEQRQAYFGLLAAGKAGGDKAAGEEKSRAAMDKTKSADKGSRKGGHLAAAALHLAAAAHHDKAGDAGRAEMHRGMAAHHEAKAESATRNEEVPTMSKADKVALLTANCRCEETKANLMTVYNGLDDESLDVLVTNAKAEGSNADATAAGTDQTGGEEDDPDAHDMPGTGVRVHAAGKLAKNADEQAWIDYAGRKFKTDQRQLASRLVANVADPARQKALFNKYVKLHPDQLTEILELQGAPSRTENRRRVRQDDPPALYLGAGGVVHSDADRTTDNARQDDDDLLLDIPVLNMREISDSYNKKGSAVA